MPPLRSLALILAACALQGCLARAAVDVVTAPVRVVSKGVDAATTSQSEADEKRGREIRRREERLGEIERDYAKELARCRKGDDEACEEARALEAEREALLPTIPVEPEED
jgi:DNA repair ATPase RecN